VQDDRRNIGRPFRPELIADYLGKRKVITISSLALGKNNTSYKLKLSDGEICVVKLYSNDKGTRERYLLQFAARLVPVPEVLHYGQDWVILPFIEGKSLYYFPESTGIVTELINSFSMQIFKTPGEIHPDGSVSAFPFGGVREFILLTIYNGEVHKYLSKKQITGINLILNALENDYVELEKHACLVHGDFNPRNILIKNNTVQAVLDWEYCHSGSPYMDVGNLLRHTPDNYHKCIELAFSNNPYFIEDWKRYAKMVDLSSQLEFLASSRTTNNTKKYYANKIGLLIQELKYNL